MVGLLHLYSNKSRTTSRLLDVLRLARSELRPQADSLPKRRHTRLTTEAITRIIARYQDGATAKQLGIDFHVNRKTISLVLKRNHVALRSPGLMPDELAEACRLYREGWSLPKLGQKFDLNARTVARALREAGVTLRVGNKRKDRRP